MWIRTAAVLAVTPCSAGYSLLFVDEPPRLAPGETARNCSSRAGSVGESLCYLKHMTTTISHSEETMMPRVKVLP